MNQAADARAIKPGKRGFSGLRGDSAGASAGVKEAALANAAHEFNAAFRETKAVVAGFEAALEFKRRNDTLRKRMRNGFNANVIEASVHKFPTRGRKCAQISERSEMKSFARFRNF